MEETMRRITLAALAAAFVAIAASTPALAGGFAFDRLCRNCYNHKTYSSNNGFDWNGIAKEILRNGQRNQRQQQRYLYERQEQIDELEIQDIQQRRYFQAIQNCRALGYTGAKLTRKIFECTNR
jgi:hypothetical protein